MYCMGEKSLQMPATQGKNKQNVPLQDDLKVIITCLIGTKQVPFLKQVLVLSVSILAPPFPDTYRGMQSYSQCNGGECQADLPNGKPEANLHNGPGLLSRKLELSLHLGSETDDHCTF